MIRRANIDKRWETKINHERWLVSYSDFITLLFAFFVVMYSVSQVNDSKYRELSQTLQSTFTEKLVTSVNDTQGIEQPVQVEDLQNIESELQQLMAGELQSVLEIGEVNITGNQDWLEIELDSSALFASASAELTSDANKIITSIADQISLNTNRIIVSGHTDNIPISNDNFANNWALSSARAVAVVNALAYGGVNPERLSAVGYGEYKPVADNSSEEGRQRNRRVVISISKSAEEPPELHAQLTAALDSTVSDSTALDSTVKSVPIESPAAESAASQMSPQVSTIKPVRLQDGSLLFSSDPDLPRINPVVSPTSQ